MKAWRFYDFGDLRLDDVPVPECAPGHVLVAPLCVQPSVTEAQLALGIPTLAYERVKRRLETDAPIQLFGHEFCAEIIETADGGRAISPGRPRCRARQAAMRRLPTLPLGAQPSVPQGTGDRLRPAGLLFGGCHSA